MKTITIVNNRGGVGKTTITHNLAAALAHMGKTILVVDLDAQCNLSTTYLDRIPDTNIYSMLTEATEAIPIVETQSERISLLPGSADLNGIEYRLMKDKTAYMRVKEILDRTEGFDYAIIDCPPGHGLMQSSGIYAADMVLIPVIPDVDSLNGASNIIKVAEKMQKTPVIVYNKFKMFANAPSMVSRAVLADLKKNFSPYLLPFIIYESEGINKARQAGKDVFSAKVSMSWAFEKLAEEIIRII